MPAATADLECSPERTAGLPFPHLTKLHILHCSVHYWHPLYRTLTPKARLVPLSEPFLSYLRSDGILLPPDESEQTSGDISWETSPSTLAEIGNEGEDTLEREDGNTDEGEGSNADEDLDPSLEWQEIHQKIKDTILELKGSVCPKLNWSAPKDALWMSATNTMECSTPNEIYLLLKSSDFVTHDLELAFAGCEDGQPEECKDKTASQIPYTLCLRQTVPSLIVSLEFRCFVRERELLAITQRDLNYYDFLPALIPTLQHLIFTFFKKHLQYTFPDPSFAFDVYIPQPKELGRVWLIDINPWTVRTDPLLFSWLELLTMPSPERRAVPRAEGSLSPSINARPPRLRSLAISDSSCFEHQSSSVEGSGGETDVTDETDDTDETDGEDDAPPVFRIVRYEDPEAYQFTTTQYSAHKLPREVVDAGLSGAAGIADFVSRWREATGREQRRRAEQNGNLW